LHDPDATDALPHFAQALHRAMSVLAEASDTWPRPLQHNRAL